MRESGAGIALTGSDEENIATLRIFFSNPDYRDELRAMGDRAVRTIECRFSRKKLASQMLDILKSAADRGNRHDD